MGADGAEVAEDLSTPKGKCWWEEVLPRQPPPLMLTWVALAPHWVWGLLRVQKWVETSGDTAA